MFEYKSEIQYKKELPQILEADFHIEPNAKVIWPLGGKKKEVDFLLKPKPHLVSNGFDAKSFAIEVKSPISKESVKKLLDCIIQSYTYSLCEYQGNHPAFVLIYPDIEKFFEYDFINKYKKDPRNEFTRPEIGILRRLMQRANVGELIIDDTDYEINFAASRYFSSRKGRSKIKNLGMIRQVGSQKTL
ncbi:MAG: hypothetical protein RBR35_12335 [Salinivirgaceae bacterium]|jgi:hypothetical protein|nr:hypothetical protein [Salinivirgaceae bacterium]